MKLGGLKSHLRDFQYSSVYSWASSINGDDFVLWLLSIKVGVEQG